jgi:hypothetical protein
MGINLGPLTIEVMRLISPAIAVAAMISANRLDLPFNSTQVFRGMHSHAEGSSSCHCRREHTGEICAKIQISIFGHFARDVGCTLLGRSAVRECLVTFRSSGMLRGPGIPRKGGHGLGRNGLDPVTEGPLNCCTTGASGKSRA